MNVERVVLTGGPSTGKTSIIELLEKKGYHCVHELVRSMTMAEKEGKGKSTFRTNPIVSVKNPEKFNQQLLKGRIAQFKTVSKSKEKIVFFDRGIPDVHAYMDCFGQTYDQEFAEACFTFRYDRVFLMPPWEKIHVVDNERLESFEESIHIYECLKKAYTKFGYSLILVPKGSIEERTSFILNLLDLT